MFDLKFTIRIIGIASAAVVLILIGDYMGSKIGRWKLAAIAGLVNLFCVIAFAIYYEFILA